VKPFGTRELLARIRALLRRSSTEETKVLSFGDVQVDLTRRVVTKKEGACFLIQLPFSAAAADDPADVSVNG
jgi:DNA-binding response OmpR family regulator